MCIDLANFRIIINNNLSLLLLLRNTNHIKLCEPHLYLFITKVGTFRLVIVKHTLQTSIHLVDSAILPYVKITRTIVEQLTFLCVRPEVDGITWRIETSIAL